ncbi:unnamed protein product [Nippostrongylus brasiliensis]|uniref:Uncharacterized protein n=1 Tax=Nippostrongylus brasiliensis TaxID=27835 RepID=A0A0N4YA25_NIPBR|nr:unnamed protein product [Nippostrongylus brasiliensis]
MTCRQKAAAHILTALRADFGSLVISLVVGTQNVIDFDFGKQTRAVAAADEADVGAVVVSEARQVDADTSSTIPELDEASNEPRTANVSVVSDGELRMFGAENPQRNRL